MSMQRTLGGGALGLITIGCVCPWPRYISRKALTNNSEIIPLFFSSLVFLFPPFLSSTGTAPGPHGKDCLIRETIIKEILLTD